MHKRKKKAQNDHQKTEHKKLTKKIGKKKKILLLYVKIPITFNRLPQHIPAKYPLSHIFIFGNVVKKKAKIKKNKKKKKTGLFKKEKGKTFPQLS
jgi:hypothetical protein